MTKIRIISPGRFSSKFSLKNSIKSHNYSAHRDIFEEYCKRLKAEIELIEIEAKNQKNLNSQTQKFEEESLILKHLSSINKKNQNGNLPKFYALDEGGKQLSSTDFAKLIETHLNSGLSELNFVIGGANGLTENIKKLASQKISLGLMTFPHLMVRCLLIEQIYRAFLINDNHPYHRQ